MIDNKQLIFYENIIPFLLGYFKKNGIKHPKKQLKWDTRGQKQPKNKAKWDS